MASGASARPRGGVACGSLLRSPIDAGMVDDGAGKFSDGAGIEARSDEGGAFFDQSEDDAAITFDQSEDDAAITFEFIGFNTKGGKVSEEYETDEEVDDADEDDREDVADSDHDEAADGDATAETALKSAAGFASFNGSEGAQGMSCGHQRTSGRSFGPPGLSHAA